MNGWEERPQEEQRPCRWRGVSGKVFDVGDKLAWIDSQFEYCTPERKCRVPAKWAGADFHLN
jgi:hypothetical protein